MHKIFLFPIGLGLVIFVSSCASQKNALVTPVPDGGAAVVGPPTVENQTGPLLSIQGQAKCRTNAYFNFKRLQLEIFHGEKRGKVMELGQFGNFKSIERSEQKNHRALLVEKKSGKVLDQLDFVSSSQNSLFDFELNACKK